MAHFWWDCVYWRLFRVDMYHRAIPVEQVGKLEFMVGSFVGLLRRLQADGTWAEVGARLEGELHPLERWLKWHHEVDGETPYLENMDSQMTWDGAREEYVSYNFSLHSSDPLILRGQFQDDRLVLRSEPWTSSEGLVRFRVTALAPAPGALEVRTEVWTPDGWVLIAEMFLRRTDEIGNARPNLEVP